MQPNSPKTENTLDDHLDIEADLAYSEKLHGLTSGHLQETKQLLKNIEQLQADARILVDENKEFREQIAAKDIYIAELEARVKQLEERPNIVADHYFEHFTANNVLTVPKQTGKRSKSKHIDNPNQLFLELWKDNPIGIL